MIIPEDGCLPKITRKGFAAFNNVMIIKVPDKLKKPGEASYQLATLDRSKKGERWPADKYVDIIMNMPTPKETNLAEKSSCSKEENIPNIQKRNFSYKGTFLPKKFQSFPKDFIGFSKKDQSQEASHAPPLAVPPNTANFNHHFVPHTFQDSQSSCKELIGENNVHYGERSFTDNTHTYRYPPNRFSNEHQQYDGLGGGLLGEGPSLSHRNSRYVAQGETTSAAASREPLIKNVPYNNDFNPHNNPHNLPLILPPKPPFNDFRRNPPPFSSTAFVTSPQEINFRTDVGNIPSTYNANNYPIGGYNEAPRSGDYEVFPYNPPHNAEFMNNNFNMPPYHNNSVEAGLSDGFNNPRNNFPPPYYEDAPQGNFRNNFKERNPHYDNRNQQNGHYNRNSGNNRRYKPWRGKGGNKFSKGNNNRRGNNNHQRKNSS